MSNFNIRAWYKGAVAAAVTLLGVSAVAKDPALLVFGLGLLLLGLGEWINHPFQSRIVPPMGYGIPATIASGEVRSTNIVGVAFDILGVSLMCVGLYRVVWPLLAN